eukprot:COSAG04_NODE_23617_length_335_cov_0.877119_1_plen_67_part_01
MIGGIIHYGCIKLGRLLRPPCKMLACVSDYREAPSVGESETAPRKPRKSPVVCVGGQRASGPARHAA